MLTIIAVMALGIVAGYLLRRQRLKQLGRVTLAIIWLLLFLLGVEAGGNDRIVNGLASLGVEALVIAVAGVLGSAALSLLLWKFSRKHRKPDARQ